MLSERMCLLQIYQKYDKFFRGQTIFALCCNLKVKDVQVLSGSGEETASRWRLNNILFSPQMRWIPQMHLDLWIQDLISTFTANN